MHSRGNAGEEAGGLEGHPGKRGGVSQGAGSPADGKAITQKQIHS